MTKKRLIIFAILVGVVILAFILSRIFRPTPPEAIPEAEELPPPTSGAYLKVPQEISESKEIKTIVEEVLKPVLSSDGKSILYFSKEDNRFYSLNLDTLEKDLLSSKTFYNVQDLEWSSKDRVLLSFYSEEKRKPIWYLYAPNTDQLIKLSDFIDDVEWVLDDQKIVYVYTDYLKKSSLSLSNPYGSDWQRLTKLEGIYRPRLFASSKKDKVAVLSGFCLEGCITDFNLRIYDLEKREFDKITEEEACIDLRWAPDDSKILYTNSELEEGEPVSLLYLLELETGEKKNLEVENFSNKCVFTKDGKILYCAVPKDGTKKAPEEWIFEDIFWKIDLETNERTQLTNFDPDLPIDATNLFLSLDERILFFTNAKDSKLYSLTLE